MNEDLSLQVSNEDDREVFVQVPIRKQDFGRFVANLLGQPEKIEGSKYGSFEATYEWLIHLHHLIDQRIKQQSHAELVDFSALFRYKDGPDRKITTVTGFLHFNEGKIVVTESLQLTWTYLISFPGNRIPEKQEISLNLITDRAEVVTVGTSRISRLKTEKLGVVTYSIAHTERTWGDDIQTLLSREIDSIFNEDQWYAGIITATIIFLMLGFFALGILVPAYIEQIIRDSEWARIYASSVPAGASIEILTVDEKLNLALKLLDPTNQLHNSKAWFRVISFIAGTALAVFTGFLFDRSAPSFIVVTKEDRKRKEKHKRDQQKSFVLKILSFTGAVAAGVAGNYLYYYLNTI